MLITLSINFFRYFSHYIQVDDFEIKNSSNDKLLGINFDNELTFNQHIQHFCTK